MDLYGKVKGLINGESGDYILPFFWQHGEEEGVLRHYMGVISDSGCKSVCVESRPHPDFCGPGWWRDLDIILDEARKRNMKVWILDDSHFPTGFANGALKNAPLPLHRQSLCASHFEAADEVELDVAALIPPEYEPIGLEQYTLPALLKDAPHYGDDELLSVTAVNRETGEALPLDSLVRDGVLSWEKPAGKWTVWVLGLSRNCGPHRDYINMMREDSCRLLLDAVYEPHWEHYHEEFGKTIAGFFSDEPELGNGHMYFMQNLLGTDQDLPFSPELAGRSRAGWGKTGKTFSTCSGTMGRMPTRGRWCATTTWTA